MLRRLRQITPVCFPRMIHSLVSPLLLRQPDRISAPRGGSASDMGCRLSSATAPGPKVDGKQDCRPKRCRKIWDFTRVSYQAQRLSGPGHEEFASANSRSTMSSIKRSCPFFHEGSKFVASECLHLLCIFHGRLLPTLRSPPPPCVHPITGTLPTLEQIEVETIHMRKVCQLSSVDQAATG